MIRLPASLRSSVDALRGAVRPTPAMAGLLLAGIASGIVAWLWLNATDTELARLAAVPRTRVSIAGAVDNPHGAGHGDPAAAGTGHAPAADHASHAPADAGHGASAGHGTPAGHGSPTAHGPSAEHGAPAGAAGHGTPAAHGDAGHGHAAPPEQAGVAPLAPEGPVTLAHAPAPGLVEETAEGPLPRIGPDGVPPWRVYARPFPADDRRFRIAIVVVDLGLRGATTGFAIEQLPPEVTLSFVPQAERLDTWVEMARSRGHEVLLQVPMQPSDYPSSDPGPNTLLVSLDPARNLMRLRAALRSVSGYVGITTTSGSRFLGQRNALLPILEQVRDRGLLYLDSGVGPGDTAVRLADELKVPWARATGNGFLDSDPSRNMIDRKLKQLEELARAEGSAIGFGRPLPSTMERVANWMLLIATKEVILVPVSAIVGRQSVAAGRRS